MQGSCVSSMAVALQGSCVNRALPPTVASLSWLQRLAAQRRSWCLWATFGFWDQTIPQVSDPASILASVPASVLASAPASAQVNEAFGAGFSAC